MDSWAGYAAVSYGQRVDGFQPYCGQAASLQPYCGQTTGLQPYCSQASLQPTYDPVFPALLHQKATYGRPDPDDWPRHHPFGVLPHEAAAATFPFPPQNPALNPHQVTGRRSPPSHDMSPSYFQTNFASTDPLQKLSDYPSRLYPNLQQSNESPLKDYRSYSRQDCDRLYEKPEPIKKTIDTDALSRLYPSLQQPPVEQVSKDYRFQSPNQEEIDATKKSLEVSDPREYSQSSPISFAMMDQRMRSPQFQQTTFRYSSVSTPDEFQRSKSSESFSSSASSDCSQRPGHLQQTPTSYVYNNNNNNNQNDCYKEPSTIDSPQRYPLTYTSVLTRDNRSLDNNRFDETYRQNWEEKRKFNYEVQRVQHFDNNQNSCRGDPMSLVRNLHNTPEKNSEVDKRSRERVVDELLREPPPAHNQSSTNQNYNFDFERWSLTAPSGSKILTQVTFGQNRLTGNIVGDDQPQSLVLPGALPYFPTFQVQGTKQTNTSVQLDKEKMKTPRPTIEEELAYLITDDKPLSIQFTPKISMQSLINVYENFIKGVKEESPPRVIKKTPYWSQIGTLSKSNQIDCKVENDYPGDPQDDPRYYPLPKSSDMRSFTDSSDDSSNDSFTSSLIQKMKSHESRQSPSKNGKRCACKCSASSNSRKKKKIIKEERSTQTLSNVKCNHSTHCLSTQTNLSNNMKKNAKTNCHFRYIEETSGRLAYSCCESSCSNVAKRSHYSTMSSKCESLPKGTKEQKSMNQKKGVIRKNKLNNSPTPAFKVDDFVILKLDKDVNYPPIWRVKEKNILQKFQHFVKDGVSLYIGLPSVVAWNSQNSNQYHSLPVNIAYLNKSTTSNIVRVIEYPFQPTRQERQFMESYLKEMAHLQDSFEVFIQTLFSQALDSNFLQEIYDEKDEYFLARVRDIEAVINGLRSRLTTLLAWSSSSLEAVSCWPSYRLAPASRPCKSCVCTKAQASCLLVLHGNPYHSQTLLRINTSNSPINKELPICSFCVKYFELLHDLSHQKLGLFICCEERVNKAGDPSKDTTSLLNYLLADQPFLNKLFREVRLTWAKTERCLKENKNPS